MAKDLTNKMKEKLNEKADTDLLKELQNGKTFRTVRLFHTARWLNNITDKDDVTNQHLIKLYEVYKNAKYYSRNYGVKTNRLLSDYLTKKELIGDKE